MDGGFAWVNTKCYGNVDFVGLSVVAMEIIEKSES